MARTVQELVAEARGRIEEIAPDRLVAQRSGIVIDVREPAEYAQGHGRGGRPSERLRCRRGGVHRR